MGINKSIDCYPIIKPGIYEGFYSGYNVKVLFENGKYSEYIKMHIGYRGSGICKLKVDDEGYVSYVD